jgi:molybdate transport system ATP-binding protein
MSAEAAASIVARFRGTLGAFVLDAAFEAPMRGVTAVFGPSGCGKTTVLRCVAGLQQLDGYLSIGGEVWQDGADFRPPYERSIGYVFQEASLFPHLSVRRNLLYGHRRALRRGTKEGARFDEVVALLGMERLLDRSPLRLSGGERQRVAVGRALLSQPRLLLMDEPLAGLDRLSKDEILPYLEALHTALAIPVLYVSHDIAEVERLADHLVLMEAGRAVACGRLPDLQADPALPIARLPEAAVALDATVTDYDPGYGLTTLAIDGGTIVVPGQHGAPGTLQRVRVGASDVSLARRPPGPSTILNVLPARVAATQAQDAAQVNVVIRLGAAGQGARLLARVTRKSWDALGVTPGDLVHAQVKSVALVAATYADPAKSQAKGRVQGGARPVSYQDATRLPGEGRIDRGGARSVILAE